MRVEQFHSKNQFIIYMDDGSKVFQSYNSVIAIKKNETITLGKDWGYSKTTSKYRNMFLGEDKATTQRKLDAGIYLYDENL